MKYQFVLPLLTLASQVLAAPAVVTQTSVVWVTDGAGNAQPQPTEAPSSSAAAPAVGKVHEVVVSQLVEINGDNTKTSLTTFTREVGGSSTEAGAQSSTATVSDNNAPSSTQAVSQQGEQGLQAADRAVTSIVDNGSSTSANVPASVSQTYTPSSTKQTTTLQSSTSKQDTQTSTSSTAPAQSSTSGGDSDFANAILNAHNEKRSQVGVSALSWSKDLEEYAQNYADQYSCSGSLTHSGGKYGENLGLGYSDTGVVDAWFNEKSDYSASSPVASHFTQVVWGSTTKLGCAKKECGDYWGAYIICSYDPAGNVAGQYGQNVKV
ncbi:hypothetical protein BN7_3478 [Wickerhamomyces ciferrii]|uniref:SCP domain-containing protein n=1 Tax=Wickerhamomyces ciferrii (strain ATCC 14091 / BCRC 22168 / CBS 111 / JCM 3599 / NBRC 0793 / NRRL Y-1031 F-60-10) TaxID=1206466 RepID=K0KRH8_WICCF|nr:uncharacterized protein BN7_3478 [Wickerhamomyces ciferrii]CCH43923.1 hypothetical protein BN7_3478 [Wickerhamomyces ciferrii]